MLPLPHHPHPAFQTAFRLPEKRSEASFCEAKTPHTRNPHAQPYHRHPRHRARPADLGQHLSRYHRIPAAEPAVHRRAYPCVAGRAVAVGVDAHAASARRMGLCRPARLSEHRLFSGHAVCGGVPFAGRFGGGAEFHADADGAGVHLVNRQTMPPKAAWTWSAAGVLGIALLVLSPQARYDGTGILAALAGAAAMALGVYLSKHRRTSLPVLAFTGWQLFIGGVFLLPVACLPSRRSNL